METSILPVSEPANVHAATAQPLLAVGSVAFDTIRTPHGVAERVLGGAATYFALAARFFTPVRIVAVVGEDFLPSHENLLASRGIDLAGLQRRPGKSFFWAGEYESNPDRRHTHATELNVFADFQPQIPRAYRDSRYLFLGNIDPALQCAVRRELPDAACICGDTMNYWIASQPERVREFLRGLHLLMINDSEAVELTGEWNLPSAARAIQALGPAHVIIKRGAHGATLYSPGGCCAVPSFPLEQVLDPTGAGDSFAGGVMGFLAGHNRRDEAGLRQALAYGSVMGSFTCERFGVERLLELTREQIEARYRQFLAITQFHPVP